MGTGTKTNVGVRPILTVKFVFMPKPGTMLTSLPCPCSCSHYTNNIATLILTFVPTARVTIILCP
jgi:hypothetical protein